MYLVKIRRSIQRSENVLSPHRAVGSGKSRSRAAFIGRYRGASGKSDHRRLSGARSLVPAFTALCKSDTYCGARADKPGSGDVIKIPPKDVTSCRGSESIVDR